MFSVTINVIWKMNETLVWFYHHIPSSFFAFVSSSGSFSREAVLRAGSERWKSRERSVLYVLSLSLRRTAVVSRKKLGFFSLLAFFAYDGQRSDFGLSCNVGCSLWARTQRGVEARAVLGKAPLRSLWIARFPMAVTLVTLLWEHRGRSPAS